MADRIFPYGEAPDNAEYVVLEPNPDHPNAKELLAGTGISITVGADTVTISGDGSSAQTYITANDETATLPNSFQITEGSNVTLDYVGSQLIISASVSGSGGGTVTIVNSGNANPLFTTNVTTATTTPTIAYTLTNAASATFFRGPASGAAGSPVYGGILGTDLTGALIAGTGITITPATAPGSRLTITAYGFQPVNSTLNALSSSLTGTGYITQIGPNSFAERAFQDSTNITWTNPAGIAGNSSANVTSNVYTKDSYNLINALATSTIGGTGLVVQQSDSSFVNRSIAGTTGNINVTNPSGTGGNPTIDVGARVFTVATSNLLNALSSSTSGGTGGIYQLSDTAFINRTLTGTTNRIVITNPNGISGAPTFDVGSDVYTKSSSSLLNYLATSAPNLGEIPLGTSDGHFLNTKPNAGPGIQMDFANGVFTVSATGATGGSGTVTNVSAIPPAAIFNTSVANATTTPTISFNVTSSTLQDLATASGSGIVVSTDGIHHAFRSVQGTTGEINVTNPAGAAGDITLALDSSVYTDRDSSVLNALATGINGTGFVSQNGAQFYDRTLTGTSNRLTITNPTGAAGDPVFDIGTDVLVVGDVTALPGIQIVNGSGTIQVGASGALGGTLTNLTVGDVSPVWTTGVSSPTTAPVVSYTLNNFASGNVLVGPLTGANAQPTLRRLLGQDIADAIVAGSNITVALVGNQLQISSTAGGSGTVTQVIAHDLPPLFTTNVATDTTTPNITFTLSNAASGTFFSGPASGGPSAGSYRTLTGLDLIPALSAGTNISLTMVGDHLQVSLVGPIDATLIANGSVSNTEFQYLDGVTSGIQGQLDGKQPLSGTLNALSTGLAGTGYIIQTGPNAFTERSLATANSNHIAITNPSGVAGASTFDIGSDIFTVSTSNVLNDLATSTSTGIVVQSDAVGHHVYRSIATADSTHITVANGSGVGANPTLDVGSAVFTLSTSNILNRLASSTPTNGQIPIGDGVNFQIAAPFAGPGIQITTGAGTLQVLSSGAANALITAGDLSPIFTTNESANNLAFTLSNTASATFLAGPASGSNGLWEARGVLGTDLTGALQAGSNITITQAAEPGSRLIISSSGGSGYSTIQEEGSDLTQRTKLNFVGAAYTAADDSGNSRTNVTAHTSVNSIAVTPTNGQIPIGNGTNFTVTQPIANYGVELTTGSGSLIAAASGAMFNIQNTGRLTLTSGQPIADATSASTLYWCASGANGYGIISLYDGTKYINVITRQKSLSITATSGKGYDVWGYLSGGDLALETLVWTDSSSRATSISTDSYGVPYKTGDQTRRWLGSFYASGTNQITDNTGLRGLYNTNNKAYRPIKAQDTTNSWTYSSSSYQEQGGQTTNGTSRVSIFSGDTSTAVVASISKVAKNDGNSVARTAYTAIGMDANSLSSDCVNVQSYFSGTSIGNLTAAYSGIPGLGLHSLRILEAVTETNVTWTWYGDNGGSLLQTGMVGMVYI